MQLQSSVSGSVRLTLLLVVSIGMVLLSGAASAAPRILVVADMEGLTGVVTNDQLGPEGFEYERFRQVMTDEVLAAMEGARAAGADEFLVADSHGNGLNLLIDQFPEDVRIIRSWPRPLGMLQGVDQGVDGVIYIGFHSGTFDLQGVRAHTMSSANLTDVKIGQQSVSEAVWGAAIAGYFDVPVLMISGDDAAIADALQFLPEIEPAVVKKAFSFHSAETLTPAAGQRLIRESAERAVRRIKQVKPYKVESPVRVSVSFKNYQPSQLLAFLPWFERPDSHSISFRAEHMVQASQIMEAITEYRADLAP